MTDRPGLDMSFSGLKTFAANTIAANVTRLAFSELKAPPVVLGAPNWIAPGADMEDKYAPQEHDICDAVLGEFFAENGSTGAVSATGISRKWRGAASDDGGWGPSCAQANGRTQIMATDILVPQLGNEVTEAEVTEWVANAGDDVSAGEVVVVISTTKAALEIEAPCDGKLAEIRVGEGELTEVGAVLGVIE